MKKILTIIGLVAGTTLLHAQGYLDFTGTSAAISTNNSSFLMNGGEGSISPGKTASQSVAPSGFYYALLYETTALTGNSAPTNSAWGTVDVFGGSTPLLGTNSVLAGSVQGTGAGSGVELAGLASGTSYSVELVGWSASLGSSWATVLAELNASAQNGGIWAAEGYFGYTAVATLTPGSTPGGAGDPTVFTSVFSNGSLTEYLVPVPEPATIALAGLGGLSMLLLRRRNNKA
jgi:hypothetical protein